MQKPTLEGMAQILEEMAADLADRHGRAREFMRKLIAGEVEEPVRLDRNGEPMRPTNDWRKAAIRDTQRTQDKLLGMALTFMKNRIAYLAAEERAAKAITRDQQKEAFLEFFFAELSETEQKEMLARFKAGRSAA